MGKRDDNVWTTTRWTANGPVTVTKRTPLREQIAAAKREAARQVAKVSS